MADKGLDFGSAVKVMGDNEKMAMVRTLKVDVVSGGVDYVNGKEMDFIYLRVKSYTWMILILISTWPTTWVYRIQRPLNFSFVFLLGKNQKKTQY